MTKHNFTFNEIFSGAWAAVKKNAWFIFMLFLSTIALRIPFFVGLISCIAVLSISLVIANGKTPTFEDVIKNFKSYKISWHFIVATFLYLLIVIAGLIVFILPGLYLAIRMQFYKFFIIENESTGPMEAIKKSMSITRGHFWKLFGFMLTITILNIIGLLLFVVGLVITIPVSILASAFVFKKLHRA